MPMSVMKDGKMEVDGKMIVGQHVPTCFGCFAGFLLRWIEQMQKRDNVSAIDMLPRVM